MSDLLTLSATEQAQLIRQGELSPVELINQSLERIENVQPLFNPFCFIFAEQAREIATQKEAELAACASHSTLPPLFGLPIAIKDFTPTRGQTTTRGSRAFKDWVPEYDAEIVKRLKRAGAIVIGKTTTPEFAWSSFTRSKLWGDTANPWNAAHTCGGSSGGSAVAVTTGCVSLAEGTDMGGSVRIPAALCGITGLKPSLGRIPMDILDSTFDNISHFGPLARSVTDAALFLSVTEGAHHSDIQSQRAMLATQIPQPMPDLGGLTVAISEDLGFYSVEADVLNNFHKMTAALEAQGARLVPAELNWSVNYAEAWLDLWAVFQATAFGHLIEEFEPDMDPGLVSLMRSGQAMTAVDYRQIESLRTQQWQQLARVFDKADALICPTMAQTAPLLDASDEEFERVDSSGKLYGLDMTAVFNNVSQCPVLSLPSGVGSNGLPTAVQIVGHPYQDNSVLAIAAALEAQHQQPSWSQTSGLYK